MKQISSHKISEQLLNKIISAAYNDAGIWDKMRILITAKRDAKIKKIFDSYKSTAAEVHKIQEEIFSNTRLKSTEYEMPGKIELKNNFVLDLVNIAITKPIISTAAVILLVGLLIVSLLQTRTIEYNYSQTEIESAHQKAKQAFAIIGKVFNETKITLEEDVLNEKVVMPINEGFEIINVLFNKGDKK
jgi:hypothetical protein